MCCARPQSGFAAAFSMLELVVVIVVIGVVASIAISRVGAAVENSRIANIAANLATLDKAVQLYVTEHDGLGPAHKDDRTVDPDPANMAERMLRKTDSAGGTGNGAVFGPYLRGFPKNPMNGLNTVRIDGPAAGRNIAGWRFDSGTGAFQADDSAASAAIKVDAAIVKGTDAEQAVLDADGDPEEPDGK